MQFSNELCKGMVAYIMFILQAKLQWLVINYAYLLAPRELKYVFKGISNLEACLVYRVFHLWLYGNK